MLNVDFLPNGLKGASLIQHSTLQNRSPNALIPVSRSGNSIDEAVEPDAGVHNHALYTVLTHQDAALRIIGIIAGMDADALKIGDTQQQRQPHLKTRRLADYHRISALRYRRRALHLLRLLARYTPQPHILLGRT